MGAFLKSVGESVKMQWENFTFFGVLDFKAEEVKEPGQLAKLMEKNPRKALFTIFTLSDKCKHQ